MAGGGFRGTQGRPPKASTIAERLRSRNEEGSHRHSWRKDGTCRCGVERPEDDRLPRAPRYLGKDAKSEWRRVGQQLKDAGLLEEVDTDALAAYCIAQVQYQKALAMLNGPEGYCPNCDPRVEERSEGWTSCSKGFHRMIEFGAAFIRRGKLMRSPFVAEKKEAEATLTRLRSEFGMTPASRSRMPAKAPKSNPTVRPTTNGSHDANKTDPRELLKMQTIASQN